MKPFQRYTKDILNSDIQQYLKSNKKNIILKRPFTLDIGKGYKDKLISIFKRNELKRKIRYALFLSNFKVSESKQSHRYYKRKNSYSNTIYNLNSYLKIAKQKYSLYTHKKRSKLLNFENTPQGLKLIFTDKEKIAKLKLGLYEDVIKDYKSEIDAFMNFENNTVTRLLDYHKKKKIVKHKLNSLDNLSFIKSEYKQLILLPFDVKGAITNNEQGQFFIPNYLSLSSNQFKRNLSSFNIFKQVLKDKRDRKDYLSIKRFTKLQEINQSHNLKREIFISLLIKALINWILKKKGKILNNHSSFQEKFNKFVKLINSPKLARRLLDRFGELFFAKKHSTRLKKKKRYLKMFHYKSKFIYSLKPTKFNKHYLSRALAYLLLSEKNTSWGPKTWIPKLNFNK